MNNHAKSAVCAYRERQPIFDNKNTQNPAYAPSLQIGPDTSLPTLPSPGGGEEEEVPRPGVMRPGFKYWQDPEWFAKTKNTKPIPEMTTWERIEIWAGGWINYFTS